MKKNLLDKSFIVVSFILMFFYGACYILTGKGFPCLFYKITGLYCPGCGITRMFISIFNLKFYQAFRYNPLVFILLILLIIYCGLDSIKYTIKKRHITIPKNFYIILLILVILFGILRNIPLFSYLAPVIVN